MGDDVVQLARDALALLGDRLVGGAGALGAQRLGAGAQQPVELAAVAHDAPGEHRRQPQHDDGRDRAAGGVVVGVD
jgi:hypothetical protein